MIAFLGVIGVTMFYGTTLGVCRKFGLLILDDTLSCYGLLKLDGTLNCFGLLILDDTLFIDGMFFLLWFWIYIMTN